MYNELCIYTESHIMKWDDRRCEGCPEKDASFESSEIGLWLWLYGPWTCISVFWLMLTVTIWANIPEFQVRDGVKLSALYEWQPTTNITS